MGIVLNAANLGSRVVRKAVGNNGIRRFSVGALEPHHDENGGLLGFLWNGFGRFVGFLVSVIGSILGAVQWTLSTVLNWGMMAVQYVWNFNWNASDADLNKQAETAFKNVATLFSNTVGSAAGWVTCGVLPGTLIMAFNEGMGLYIFEQLGEAAAISLASQIAVLLQQLFNAVAQGVMIWLYQNIRNLVIGSDSTFAANLKSSLGLSDEEIKRRVEHRHKPWSFAIALEEKINSIPNEFIRDQVHAFEAGFSQGCMEAGYCVVNSIEHYLASQKSTNKALLGSQQGVEILLERDISTPVNPDS